MALFNRSGYWQHVNPAGAIGDFITVFKQAGENRWRIAALAAACTFGVFSLMWQEGASGPPKPPKITYITSFAPGRTDADIAASNRENQKFQAYLDGEQQKREDDARRVYKTIGRVSGMDVDAIDAKARAEDAAAKKAEAAKMAAILAAEHKSAGTDQGGDTAAHP